MFTEIQLKILKKANITEDRYKDCYFTVDNKLFIASKNMTAQEIYENFLNNKQSVEKPNEEQQLLSKVLLENAYIKEQLKEQQELIAAILLKNAQLKGENTDV